MERDDENTLKRLSRYLLWIGVGLIVLWLNYDSLSQHMGSNQGEIKDFSFKEEEIEKYKEPAVAGLFYAAKQDVLFQEMGKYVSVEYDQAGRKPKMLIVPHVGYKYSEQVSAKAYATLLKYKKSFDTIVVIGPSNSKKLKGIALPKHDYFKTPSGKIFLDKKKIATLVSCKGFAYNNRAFSFADSVEGQLPFLQKIFKKFKIVPIIYGRVDEQKLVNGLNRLLDDDRTLFIFSADLSHYYKFENLQEIDTHTARMIDLEKANLKYDTDCGGEGINAALLLAQKKQMNVSMIDVSSRRFIPKKLEDVWGNGAWNIDEEEPLKEKTSLEQEIENLKTFANIYGQDLLKVAEKSVNAAVQNKDFGLQRTDYPDILFDKGAAFVTLYYQGKLRGRKGSLLPKQAIIRDVSSNAKKAATEDIRFKAINEKELKDLKISISFLTDYERIRYQNKQDLLTKFVQGTDGIVLRDGDRQGVFLPTVWNNYRTKEEFLNALLLKAGLSPNYWSNRIKFYRFRTVEIKRNEN